MDIRERFIRSAQADAKMIVTEALGHDLTLCGFPDWHVQRRVPTYQGALKLAKQQGLRVLDEEIRVAPLIGNGLMSDDYQPRQQALAQVKMTDGRMTWAGAGRSQDPVWSQTIARGLAFRAAVKKLCCEVVACVRARQSYRNGTK